MLSLFFSLLVLFLPMNLPPIIFLSSGALKSRLSFYFSARRRACKKNARHENTPQMNQRAMADS